MDTRAPPAVWSTQKAPLGSLASSGGVAPSAPQARAMRSGTSSPCVQTSVGTASPSNWANRPPASLDADIEVPIENAQSVRMSAPILAAYGSTVSRQRAVAEVNTRAAP